MKEFIGTGAGSGDFFGRSVPMDGDVVVVGAPRLDLGTTNSAGTVFRLTGPPSETDGSITVAHTDLFNGSVYRILRGEP